MSARIERHLAGHLSPGRQASIPLAVISTYLAGALITLLRWWLDNRLPYPPERIDEIFRQLALPGVVQLLGPAA